MMPMTESRVKKTVLSAVAGMMLVMGVGFIVAPAEAQFSPTFEFLKALKKDDYAGVKSNLMQGANVNAKDDDGRPALIIATDMGEPALVKFLLDQNAHVDETNKATGETALMRAAEAGDKVSVGVLLYYKANVNEQDKHGETPLIKASRAGRREIVKILLDTGADVNLQDYTGQTALDHVQNTREKAIERMLKDAEKH
jgi:ankyrin repeat protein